MVSGFLICLFVSCADSVLSLVTGKAIRLPECTSSCYSRTGLGKLIHCLSSPHEIRGLVFQGSPIFKGMSVGMTGSRTLHFMCLVCQLLSPWGPRGGGMGRRDVFFTCVHFKALYVLLRPAGQPDSLRPQNWSTARLIYLPLQTDLRPKTSIRRRTRLFLLHYFSPLFSGCTKRALFSPEHRNVDVAFTMCSQCKYILWIWGVCVCV